MPSGPIVAGFHEAKVMRSRGLCAVRSWACPILLAGVALAFDAADRWVPFSILGTGLIDEVAHLATAALGLLVLACFIDVPWRFYVAAIAASVANDLDHVPLYLGLLGNQNQRPVTHSLATVVVIAGIAAASRRHRAVLAGAATGLVLHFTRDITEGPPGVRMLWPLQRTAWIANDWWFLAMIIAFAGIRLVLVSADIAHMRARLFQTPAPSSQTRVTGRRRRAGAPTGRTGPRRGSPPTAGSGGCPR